MTPESPPGTRKQLKGLVIDQPFFYVLFLCLFSTPLLYIALTALSP